MRLGEIDEISLEVGGTVIERLDGQATPASDDAEAGEDDDDAAMAGPLHLAIDDEAGEAPGEGVPAPAAASEQG